MNYNGTIVVTILTCFTQPILNNKVARAIRPSQSRFSFEYDHQLLIPPPAYDINNGIYQQARGTWYKCLMMVCVCVCRTIIIRTIGQNIIAVVVVVKYCFACLALNGSRSTMNGQRQMFIFFLLSFLFSRNQPMIKCLSHTFSSINSNSSSSS